MKCPFLFHVRFLVLKCNLILLRLKGRQAFYLKGQRVNILGHCPMYFIVFFFSKIYYLFIYLFNLFLSVSGLSCGTQDLC